jgi:hypothetical protein
VIRTGSAAALGATYAYIVFLLASDSRVMLPDPYYEYSEYYWAPLISTFAILAGIPVLIGVARSRLEEQSAAGLLFGFAASSGIVLAAGRYEGDWNWICDEAGTCTPWVTPVFQPAIVIACVTAAWLLARRRDTRELVRLLLPARRRPLRPERLRQRPTGLRSGIELIRDLERKLAVSVIVESVDVAVPARITAILRYGPRSQEVTVKASTEVDAWRQLAELTVAWRNANENLMPLWAPGI